MEQEDGSQTVESGRIEESILIPWWVRVSSPTLCDVTLLPPSCRGLDLPFFGPGPGD